MIFYFAEEQAELVNDDAVLFLQPEWSKKEEMTPLIVDCNEEPEMESFITNT
jgi:hypothetical protein